MYYVIGAAAAIIIIALVILVVRARRRAAPPAQAPIEAKPPEPAIPEVPSAPVEGLPPAPPQFLEARTTDGKVHRFPLNRLLLTIGRAADNNIVIGDDFPGASSVADHHARIKLRDPWVVIEAASLSTAVFVNGQRTGRNILRNGWRVTLGEVEFTFRTAGLGTAPLTDLEQEAAAQPAESFAPPAESDFAPLPNGALLANRYLVIETRSEAPSLNSYVVESFQPVLRCAQCGDDGNSPERKTCRICGASLAGSMVYYPHYHVRESADEKAFNMELRLIGLSHPNVLLPREAFDEIPYGAVIRHYVVEPETPLQIAANLRVPQEMPQVLEWTQQLAQGMAYLHNNGVALGPIDLWRVALDGHRAQWIDMAPCEFVSEDERAARLTQEVRALAEIAYYLFTGKRKYDKSLQLSPPGVAALFERILDGVYTPSATQLATALQAALVEVRRPSSVDVRVGRLSDVGQVRQLNEDSLLTIEIGQVRRSISEPLGLYAVCDGMGGHAAGDVASSLVVQTLARKALSEVLSDGIAEDARPNWEGWLRDALQEANQAVFGHRRASGTDMGTTCVAVLVHGDQAIIAHAGDSRCYLINEQGIRQLTTDHSLVQRLVQMGQLSEEEARVHPQRNVIYKNLGDRPVVEPDVVTQLLADGDRLLLCSDGLSSMVKDEQIRKIVLSASSPQEACRQLVQAANKAGGEDNISVIVIQVEALG